MYCTFHSIRIVARRENRISQCSNKCNGAMASHPKRASFYADLDLLQTHFEALDKQTTGYIGYSELTQLVRDMPTFEDSMVPELMERLDRDKDGRVSESGREGGSPS